MNKEIFMEAAITNAMKAKGHQKPNPMVGAVIVKNNRIIGMGYHKTFGKNHAEVNAVLDAQKSGHDLSGSEIFITLSPCSKSGKTSACTDLIIKNGIANVYYGTEDISDKHFVNALKKNGIGVNGGILKDLTDNLVKDFTYNFDTGKPYLIGKTAMTIDGKIATSSFDSKWITSEKAREYARKRRSFFQAILVGSNTIKKDNPLLSCRSDGYKDPIIIVVNSSSSLTGKENIFKSNTQKIIFTTHNVMPKFKNTKFIYSKDSNIKVKFIIDQLYSMGIKSVLVEGGSYTLNTFIKKKALQGLDIYIAPKILGDQNAISAFNFQKAEFIDQAIGGKLNNIKKIGDDLFLEMEL